MKYVFKLDMFHNSVCHIGSNNYFNPYGEKLRLLCAEEKNIFIGDDGMISSHVFITVTDSHLVFDSKTFQRINYANSIYIGDHVWIGRMSSVFKGARIGSGTIIGSCSVFTNKTSPSNTLWVGVPAKQKKSDVFFVGYNAQPYQEKDIKEHSVYKNDKWVFNEDDNAIKYDQIESDLNSLTSPIEKANYLVKLNKNKMKNRFYIS